MTTLSPQSRLAPVARLVDGLCDPARRDRLAAVLLVCFVVIYTLYAMLASSNTDLHRDVLEAIGWSRQPALGYHHPPLSAWAPMLWFAVFPYADWSAHLLAASTSGLTLWIAWILFGEYLDERKRVLALAMLMLVPLYTFHALKFNANVVIMPFWAAATLFFIRSYFRLDAKQAALAGAAAGLAMLGKYWSIYLIAGFCIAALLHPRRKDYFTSSAPWISAAVGFLVLAPHLWWIASGQMETLKFVADTAAATRWRSFTYLAGAMAYITGPLVIYAALRPSRAALSDTVFPGGSERWFLACIFWCGLVLPAVVNFLFPTRLSAIWTMPNWTLLPVVLLMSPLVQVSRDFVVKTAAVAIALAFGALALSPLGALLDQVRVQSGSSAHLRLVTAAAEKLWHEQTTRPLRFVGGDEGLAYGIMFYSTERAFPVKDFRKESIDQKISQGGIMIACPVENGGCVSLADRLGLAHKGRREEIEVHRDFLGIRGYTAHYVLLAIPPP